MALADGRSKAVVLGASGQLGSRIHDFLEASGYEVLCPERPDYLLPAQEFANKFGAEQELIVNLAGPSASFVQNWPEIGRKWPVSHGKRLAAMRKVNPQAVCLHASSVAVYGTDAVGMITEESPLDGHSLYAEMHIRLEAFLEVNSEGWTILRLANSFGSPGASGKFDSTTFTHDLVGSFAKQEIFRVRDTAGTSRDFFPTGTIVNIITWMGKRSSEQIFNVATGRSSNLHDWANKVALILRSSRGLPCEIEVVGNENAKDPAFEISIAKLQGAGFVTPADIHEELIRLADYCLEGVEY